MILGNGQLWRWTLAPGHTAGGPRQTRAQAAGPPFPRGSPSPSTRPPSAFQLPRSQPRHCTSASPPGPSCPPNPRRRAGLQPRTPGSRADDPRRKCRQAESAAQHPSSARWGHAESVPAAVDRDCQSGELGSDGGHELTVPSGGRIRENKARRVFQREAG